MTDHLIILQRDLQNTDPFFTDAAYEFMMVWVNALVDITKGCKSGACSGVGLVVRRKRGLNCGIGTGESFFKLLSWAKACLRLFLSFRVIMKPVKRLNCRNWIDL
jgi:hypothetical protein